jgi:hypothetical protein
MHYVKRSEGLVKCFQNWLVESSKSIPKPKREEPGKNMESQSHEEREIIAKQNRDANRKVAWMLPSDRHHKYSMSQ